ncbi:MAG: hypothetical protein KOO61_04720 [Spirochaetales bacterium]|nr:hypothetical protein [Spirochaetales bacterium]
MLKRIYNVTFSPTVIDNFWIPFSGTVAGALGLSIVWVPLLLFFTP